MVVRASGRSGVLVCLVLLTAGPTAADLSLLTSEEGFVVSVDGTELFNHTSEDPIIWVGYGHTNFTEHQGNFKVEEDLLLKLPLQNFQVISNTPDRIELVLQSAEDAALTVDFSLTKGSETEEYSVVRLSAQAVYPSDSLYNRLWVRLSTDEEERVWGAGEQYSYLNLRGHYFPIWTTEQGVGRDGIIANISDLDGGAGGHYYTTYYPQASFLSSKRYSMLIQDHRYLVLDFTDPTRHEVFLHSDRLEASTVWGSSLLGTVQAVTTILGTQPPLPEWIINGACLGLQHGTQQMLYYYDMAKSAGVVVSALWVQDWSGTTETAFGHRVYWNWRWNQTYYPDLDLTIQTLLEDGVRVMTYINPHLIEGSDMFQEAATLGYLMMDGAGDPYRQDFGGFLAGTVDLLNPEAKAWYRDEMVKNMVDLGLAGWMADFGEYTRPDMFSANPAHDLEARHNLLPVEWASCNREVLEASGQLGQVVPFMRSGGLGASGYQVLAWAGDQNVDWSLGDGVATTIVAALSLALSGMGVTHFDIGGYTAMPPVLERSKELFLRSAEYAVFTPVMRTHEGNKPEANHQFYSDEDTLKQFARLSQIHSKLLPYTRELLQELYTTGTPVQRPLFLDFEGDSGSWDIQYQYLYGPDLLVAPVIHKNQETQTVYLPGGETGWTYLWGTETVQGPVTVTIPSPLGYPAVYYRQNSSWISLFQEINQEFGLESKRRLTE
nr:sulfoquinovosidase-like [Procambarus clarkii]XP_045584155.1 sulfoquinovosidase-like [Procambarus clarkii]XP_045584156.1 sulfoquinovosidase-like [Procambarus clarkii]XP_045584157.1 sulfoquinovosidase-like [Procambarus clarkii]